VQNYKYFLIAPNIKGVFFVEELKKRMKDEGRKI
jgi:hypothetical protein